MEKIGKRIQIIGNEIHIQSPKHVFMLLFMFVWMIAWSFGGMIAIVSLITGSDSEAPVLFTVIWLFMWLFGEIFALVVFLWGAFGKEMLTVQGGDLIISMAVFGHGLKKRYQLSNIKNLRASGFFGSPIGWASNMRMYGISGGVIAFDYNGKTKRFGIGLKEEEATQLVEQMKNRLGIL